uniref:class II aldolase/adducin family protein n=1 Tax=Enterocloster asparagiformis TaxID=333367 RepID=UPI002A80B3C6
SSEIKMHLRVYQENPRLQAVTHAHPPMATCFAIAGQPLDAAILTEAILSLGTIPVARYATPGTQEVPDSIAPFVNHYNGVLLANHGALTWGDDIYQAFYRLESVEYYATILMYTGNIIGQQNHLSCEQVDRLLEIRKNMGITGGGVPPCMNGGQLTKVCESCAAAGGTQTGPQAPLKGVTPLVRPGDAGKMPGGGLGAGSGSPSTGSGPADKDALIAEIVRRVVVQLKA